jgi:DNA-binding NarL/FixJ family response regulator
MIFCFSILCVRITDYIHEDGYATYLISGRFGLFLTGCAMIIRMSITVLLVEDHKILREGSKQLLEQYPDIRVVAEAADGQEAVVQVEKHTPNVVVMDVRLPKLNGIEATRLITSRFPGVKVLILSAYADDSYVFPLLEAGASGYLLKTSSGGELAEAIRLVHNNETALSPRISAKLISRVKRQKSAQADGMPERLTARELAVLRTAAAGSSNKEIASSLGISVQTVQVHFRNIFGKLGVRSRSEAIVRAIQYGWIFMEKDDE